MQIAVGGGGGGVVQATGANSVKGAVLQDFRFSFRPGLWVSHVVIISQ